ncbi:MAG TPA: restriction endonuclease subunit S [Pyrinomonadaceae bacterium]|jgi:type I restriction enzyme S subunit|nr:restriction endonuclease subunit S [Pyrinomonadaceae bacterium]
MNETNSLPESPEGWINVSLGDVVEIISGFGFPEKYQGKTEGDVPFFKVADISSAVKSGGSYLTSAKHYVTFDECKELKATPLKKGTIVFAKIGEAIKLNRRAILGQDSLIDNNVMGLFSFSEGLNNLFLFYFFLTVKLGDISQATTVPSVRKSDVEQILLPLAPLHEQERIVIKIEELFTRLDAGVDALKKAQAQLGHYRQAVLKAAATGELTREWREAHKGELEPAADLLERILTERRAKWETDQLTKMQAAGKPPKNDGWKQKYQEPVALDSSGLPELPNGWMWTNVNCMIVEPICNGISIKGTDTPPGIPALKLSAMSERGFKYEYIRYLPLSEAEVEDLYINEGDFFVSRGNGSKKLVGRGTLAQTPPFKIIFSDLMIRLRLASELRASRWLPAIWPSPIVRQQVERKAKTTAGIWKIAQPDVASISIPFPPFAEQKQIVSEVERLLSNVDAMEHTIEQSLKQAERLRQSILQQAFAGKLVSQDLNDEPASTLLERIREERANKSTAAPKQKRKSSKHKQAAQTTFFT